MAKYFIAGAIIFIVLFGWIIIQSVARIVAAKHPELGPAREEGGGCGVNCGCQEGECKKQD